ncbi:MAG: TM1266 family iron-only hydrogenase system putative regulator [Dethiobacteria bacterium]|jgi:putative iron-only hydrogenase system regulator
MKKTKGTGNRIGFVGIAIENRELCADKVNDILSAHADLIVGRLGVPYRERNVSVIALIVDGNADEIGALSGKLGKLKGVQVKVASLPIE